MIDFVFETDESSREFCYEIIEIMMNEFGIDKEEAAGRINHKWKRIKFVGKYNLIYHEPPEFWAYDIYYGPQSRWWKKDKKELKALKPIPYPEKP